MNLISVSLKSFNFKLFSKNRTYVLCDPLYICQDFSELSKVILLFK